MVAVLLGGSYMSLLRNKHKQERDGTNPICMFFLHHIIVFGSIKAMVQMNN